MSGPDDPIAGVPLFEVLLHEREILANESSGSAMRGIIELPAGYADRIGEVLFANLRRGGYCTLLVTGRETWDPRSSYYEACREAARRGRRIERAFLLPARHLRSHPSLTTHQQLDREAGIDTSILLVGDLLRSLELPPSLGLDFGVWDDEVACLPCVEDSGPWHGVSLIMATARSHHLDTLAAIWAKVQSDASRLDGQPQPDSASLEEPMVTSAPLAYELARVLCKGDRVDENDCSWYHCAWQYLRILDVVSTPTWHSQFYMRALRENTEGIARPSVLISGSADYSMLAHVLWAVSQADAVIDVLDVCQTPLFLCQWYAKLIGRQVSVFLNDIFDHVRPGFYDVIATDAFITRFLPEDRVRLLRHWLALLAPGGRIVTTVRIEAGGADGISATEEEVKAFQVQARRLGRTWSAFLPLTSDEIAQLARTYAQRMVSQSLSTLDELESLVYDAGLEIVSLEKVTVPGEMHRSEYARVVAGRKKC
jgi:hypothetical protein